MAELARGTVADRPWGLTLGALGIRQCTGQLTLHADGKQYSIVFDGGAVVAASSPLANDSAPRIALVNHLVAPGQVAEITRQIAEAPERDEVDILSDVARLDSDQMLRLRRKLIAQRAARTFAVDHGEFVIDSDVTLPVLPGTAIDVRGVIYLGARTVLSELRLADELRPYGSRFTLAPDAAPVFPQFAFTEDVGPVLQALGDGATFAELEARHRDIDPRTVRAVVYSLVSCSVATVSVERAPTITSELASRPQTRPSTTPSELYSRTNTGTPEVFVSRTATGQHHASEQRTRTTTEQPSTARTMTQRDAAPTAAETQPPSAEPRTHAVTGPPQPRTATSTTPMGFVPGPRVSASTTPPTNEGVNTPRAMTPRSATPTVPIASRTQTPVARAPSTPPLPRTTPPPFPAVRGSSPSVPPEPSRTTSPGVPATPRTISPGAPVTARTTSPGVVTPSRTSTPSAPPRTTTPSGSFPRRDPTSPTGTPRLNTGSTPPATVMTDVAVDPKSDIVAAAREAFRRGQSALRDEALTEAIAEFTKAVEYTPNEVDYQATLAWARFCAASDKQLVADTTRNVLTMAIRKSQSPEVAQFYLGRVERMLGRDKEALRHFHEVLFTQPKHADAKAEIRVIETRMAAAKNSGSFFGRKR